MCPVSPPKLQTTKGLGYASTMHSRVRGLPGALPSTDRPGRMLGETENSFQDSRSQDSVFLHCTWRYIRLLTVGGTSLLAMQR